MTDNPRAAEVGARLPADYAVVHLVSQELFKDLIEPQVLGHMAWQRSANGPGQPSRVCVAFIEAARVAVSKRARARVQALRERWIDIDLTIAPVIGRLGERANASLIARALRPRVGSRRLVFHCRTESAVARAISLQPQFPGCGIVADIRGAWPEELLFGRGYDSPDDADAATQRAYHAAYSMLHTALAQAGAVLSVSTGMVDWLHRLGVDARRLAYVPCCVTRTSWSPELRGRARHRLGLENKLVVAYLGIIARYQHLQDRVIPFFQDLRRSHPEAHLLALTNDPAAFREMATGAGVLFEDATILHAPHAEVGEYLAAADCGVMLKTPGRLDRYWQPIKFAEYLASGLPVIVSEQGVGRVAELVRDSGAGLVVSYTGHSDDGSAAEAARAGHQITTNGEAMRRAALALCDREFVWARYTSVVRDCYARALAWARA